MWILIFWSGSFIVCWFRCLLVKRTLIALLVLFCVFVIWVSLFFLLIWSVYSREVLNDLVLCCIFLFLFVCSVIWVWCGFWFCNLGLPYSCCFGLVWRFNDLGLFFLSTRSVYFREVLNDLVLCFIFWFLFVSSVIWVWCVVWVFHVVLILILVY